MMRCVVAADKLPRGMEGRDEKYSVAVFEMLFASSQPPQKNETLAQCVASKSKYIFSTFISSVQIANPFNYLKSI